MDASKPGRVNFTVLSSIVLVVSLIYFLGLMYLLFFMPRKQGMHSAVAFIPIPVTVIVAFRNEAVHLGNLCKAFESQTYPKEYLNIIFVNDHSEDRSANILADYVHTYDKWQVLGLAPQQEGKKAALREGILNSDTEYLLFTDADCRLKSGWVEAHVRSFQTEGADMCLGPVLIEDTKKWALLEQLEFAALGAVTAASAGAGNPVLSNGANLSVKRSCFPKEATINESRTSSGDDVFLLHECKSRKASIHYMTYPEALVRTVSSSGVGRFIDQRVRWASKLLRYTDFAGWTASILIFLFNAAFPFMLIAGIWEPLFLQMAALVFLLRIFAESLFLKQYFQMLGRKMPWLLVPVLAIVYPLYILIVFLLMFWYRPKWKGRRIRV